MLHCIQMEKIIRLKKRWEKIRVIFLGKNKPSVIKALKYLIEKNIEVKIVIGSLEKNENSLIAEAQKIGIQTISNEELYKIIKNETERKKKGLDSIDLVISYLFWKKIEKPLIELSKIGCINFHPAPLPDFRGVNGYSFAIYENSLEWGVSVHFVDENFDTGDIIKVNRFPINPSTETAFSLETKSQGKMFELFKEVIDTVKNENALPRIPQEKGKYRSKEEFEKIRRIKDTDSLDEIERKIRAFWYPPYEGAVIKIQNKEFTIINKQILEDLKK